MLAEDPLAPEVIQLLKYFYDFTKFIHQDTKTLAQSCSNTIHRKSYECRKSERQGCMSKLWVTLGGILTYNGNIHAW